MASMPLMGPMLGAAVLTTTLRYQVNARFCGARLFQLTKPSARASLVEESWLLVCSSVLLVLSTWVVTRHNDACTFLDHSRCFANWQHQMHAPQQQLVFSLTLGWYLHGILKSLVPGVGLHAGLDMVWHHLVTVVIFAASYAFQLERPGLLLLSILNISNPFMHVAKVLHYGAAAKKLKVAAFALFAVAFFVSRLILYPIFVYYDGVRAMLAYLSAGALAPGLCTLALATVLQGLQVFWFYRIVRLLVTGGADKPSSKSVAAPSDAPVAPSPPPLALKAETAAGADAKVTLCAAAPEALILSEKAGPADGPRRFECSAHNSERDDTFLFSDNGSEQSHGAVSEEMPVASDDSAYEPDSEEALRKGDFSEGELTPPFGSLRGCAPAEQRMDADMRKKVL